MAGADLFVLPGIELLDPGGDDFTLGEVGRRETPFIGRNFIQDLGMFVKSLPMSARKFQPVFHHEVEKLLAIALTCCGARFPAPKALDILLFIFRKPDGLRSDCGDNRILLYRRASGANDRSKHYRGEIALLPCPGQLRHAHSRAPENERH